MRNLSFQLLAELHKMFARKRTYIGFGAFAVLELAFLYFLHREGSQRWFERTLERNTMGAFDEYYSGLTLATMVLRFSLLLLGGLYLALVAGDIVSKEAEEGTLRMLMSRPVSRFRLLVVKYFACILYTLALTLYIGVTSLVFGWLARGWGGGLFFFFPPGDIFVLLDFGEGLFRYLAALPFLTLSVLTISSIAFMFSCYPMKPAAATILTLSVIFIDFILNSMPMLQDYRHYFLTTRMTSWMDIFVSPVPWERTIKAYAVLIGVDVTCFTIGWFGFACRDLKT